MRRQVLRRRRAWSLVASQARQRRIPLPAHLKRQQAMQQLLQLVLHRSLPLDEHPEPSRRVQLDQAPRRPAEEFRSVPR